MAKVGNRKAIAKTNFRPKPYLGKKIFGSLSKRQEVRGERGKGKGDFKVSI
jgi:hypothetical protein